VVAQLRSLDKFACRIRAGIRARTTLPCTHCGCATATRPLQLGDAVPDRRRGAATQRSSDVAPGVRSAGEPSESQATNDLEQAKDHRQMARRAVHVAGKAKLDAPNLQRTTVVCVPRCLVSRIAVS
jgi:hypothetical protein